MAELEHWRDIKGYVGLYEISDKGRVKPEDAEKRELLHEFYHSDFHKKHPNYEVNGVEYFQALGKL